MTGEAPRLIPNYAEGVSSLRESHAREQRKQQRLMVETFRQSLGTDPTFAANVQRIAGSLGVPADGLYGLDPKKVGQIMAVRDLEARDLAGRNPVLARQLTDRNFASIAHDDLDNLGAIEGLFTEMGRHYQAGKLTIEQGSLAELWRTERATDEQIRELAKVQRRMRSLPQSATGLFTGAAKGVGYLAGTLPTAIETGLGMAGTAAVLGQLPGANLLPEELVTVPAMFSAGFGGGVWMASYRAEAGNAFLEMLQRGYDWDVANEQATVTGIINATLELGGFGALAMPLKKGLRAAIGKSLAEPGKAASLLQKAFKYTLPITAEMATEFAQEAVNVWRESVARDQTLAIDESARTVIGFDESFRPVTGDASEPLPEATWDEIADRLGGILVETFYSQALLGGFAGGVSYWADQQSLRRAEKNYEYVKSLAKAYEQSKAAERAPEAVDGFVKEAQAEGEAPDLYFQGKDVLRVLQEQGHTLEQLEQVVPGIGRQLQESAATGDLVVIEASAFDKIQRSEFGAALLPHVRVADDMSFAEAQERDAKAMQEEYERRDATETQRREELREIEESKRQELQGAGQEPTLARANAKAYRRMVDQLTPGRSPKAFQESQGLRVAPVGATPENTPVQGGEPALPSAYGVTFAGVRDAYEFYVDDRGHGDEYAAEVVSQVAEQMFGVRSFAEDAVIEGDGTELANAFALAVERRAEELRNADESPDLFNQDGDRRTDTPEFKAWFGESKVVDEKGEPLVVYHGTKAGGFTEFSPQKTGSRQSFDQGFLGRGFYFGDARTADVYAGRTGSVMPVFLSLRNPLRIQQKKRTPGTGDQDPEVLVRRVLGLPAGPRVESETFSMEGAASADDVSSALREQGYDGVEFVHLGGDVEWLALDPTQIKSVNNRGTWSPTDPNILHQGAGAPEFFSALLRGVESLPTKSATAAGWKQAITGLVNKGKAKQEEVDWTGLIDWLDMQEGKVTKEQVQEFLAQNGVRVETVVRGGQDRTVVWNAQNALRNYLKNDLGWPPSAAERVVDSPVAYTGDDARARELRDALVEANRRASLGDFSTKFSQYTLPGSTNYREVLLTLPRGFANPERVADRATIARVAPLLDDVNAEIERLSFPPHTTDAASQERRGALMDERTRLQDEFRAAAKRLGDPSVGTAATAAEFRSGHFDEPNVVAHLRLNDRTDADGKRVLFVEEVQSDWAQKGRKEGFAQGVDRSAFDALQARIEELRSQVASRHSELVRERGLKTGSELLSIRDDGERQGMRVRVRRVLDRDEQYQRILGELREAEARSAALAGELTADQRRIPRAPFVSKEKWTVTVDGQEVTDKNDAKVRFDSEEAAARHAKKVGGEVKALGTLEHTEGWLNLALKKVLMLAVEGGYDKVAFINGEQSAERYDLSKQVDYIERGTAPDDDNSFTLALASGAAIDMSVSPTTGRVIDASDARIVGDELSDVVGKDVAERMMKMDAGMDARLEGEGLQVGGEGMRDFYDNIVPKAAAKLAKKLGGEVGTVETAKMVRMEWDAKNDIPGEDLSEGQEPAEGYEARDQVRGRRQWFGIDITDAMREKVQAGLELFARGPGGNRASFRAADRMVFLYNPQDPTSFLHEMFHGYVDILEELLSEPLAEGDRTAELERQRLTRQFQRYLNWLGIEDTAAWQALSKEDKVKAHERGAYAFEVWLGTGEVPGGDAEIHSLFRKILRWVAQFYGDVVTAVNAIYKSQFGEDLPALTPEVREFFGAIFSAHSAVEQSMAARGFEPLFDTKPANMTDEQWDAMRVIEESARERALETLARQSMRIRAWARKATKAMHAKMESASEEVRSTIADEVRRELEQQPVYRLLRFLKTGEVEQPDGSIEATTLHRLQTTATKALLGDADLRAALPGMTHKDGVPPDVLADQFGFRTAREMLDAILAARPLEDVVAEETDQRLMAEYGALADPEQRDAAIDRALHNEEQARRVALHYRWLAGVETSVRELVRAARGVAERLIGKRQIMRQAGKRWQSNIRPRQFSISEGRLAREARYRMTTGETDAAIVAKRQELLQNQMAVVAREVLDEQAKAERLFKLLAGKDKNIAKTRQIDAVNVARALLQSFGLYDAAPLPLDEALTVLSKQNPLAYANVSEQVQNLRTKARDWRTLTVDEYLSLADTIRALWHNAKLAKTIDDRGEKVAFEGVKAQVLAGFQDHIDRLKIPEQPSNQAPDKKSLRARLSSTRASLRQVESWALEMDGGKPGVIHKYFFALLRERFDDYLLARDAVYKGLANEIKKVKRQKGPVRIAARPDLGEFDYVFTSWDELLGFLLHLGNEDNLRINAVGRKWIELDDNGNYNAQPLWNFVNRLVREGVLTQQHLDLVQHVWDAYDGLRPHSQQAHRDNYGYPFPEIDIRGFDIEFPDGTRKHYKGGYTPAPADRLHNENVHAPGAAALQEGQNGLTVTLQTEAQRRPTTGRGHTIERTGINRPLLMSLSDQPGFLDEHLRFIHLQRAGRDILKLLYDKDIAKVLWRIDRTAFSDMFLPFLDRTLNNRTVRPGLPKFWSDALQALRRHTSTAYMFASVPNAAQQLTGLATTINEVGLKHTRAAASAYVAQLRDGDMAKAAFDKSKQMQARIKLQMGQIVDDIKIVFEPTLLGDMQRWTEKNKFFMQQFFQNPVDIISWHAGYNAAIAEGATETEAIRRGDSVVRTSQGSATAPDISRFEAGNPVFRLFTLFSTFWMKQYNVIQSKHGADRAKAIAVILGLAGVVAGAIAQALRGGWEDDDDDGTVWDEVTWWAGSELAQTAAAVTVPVVGPMFVRPLVSDFGNDRVSLGAAFGGLDSMVRFVNRVPDIAMDPDKDWRGRDWKDVGVMLTELLGLPVSAAMRPVQYWHDVATGAVEPAGTLDAIRGTVTGAAAPGTRR